MILEIVINSLRNSCILNDTFPLLNFKDVGRFRLLLLKLNFLLCQFHINLIDFFDYICAFQFQATKHAIVKKLKYNLSVDIIFYHKVFSILNKSINLKDIYKIHCIKTYAFLSHLIDFY